MPKVVEPHVFVKNFNFTEILGDKLFDGAFVSATAHQSSDEDA